MDPEGGSWVDGIYQKFEAICAEVEEAMSEDTLKYVENQVWSVGKTVKKFYSDVLQDLHQPPSLDTVKSEDPLMTVIHPGDDEICRKPKVDDKIKSVDAASEKMLNNVNGAAACDDSIYYGSHDSAICSVIKPCEPTSNRSHKDKCTKVKLRIRGTKLANQSTYVAKILDCRKDSQNKRLSNSPSINATVTNNTDEEVTFIVPLNKSDKPSSVHRDVNSVEASEVSDNEKGVGVPRYMIEGYEGGDVINEKETKVLSGEHISADIDISPKKANAADLSSTITSTKENFGKFDEQLSIFQKETPHPCVSCELEKYDADADKPEVLVGEQLNPVKLEDSCVLVDINDNSAKSALENVQKSYKKKIQDVFSPKRWSKSKQNQEQYAVWYDEQGRRSFFISTMQAEIQKLQIPETFESDWELL